MTGKRNISYKKYFFLAFRFRNGFRSVFRCFPCVKWSPEYSCEGNVSCRSLSEPTALSVIYSYQRRSRATFSTPNSPQQSITTTELSMNLNQHHR
jgi:hypothetical protein